MASWALQDAKAKLSEVIDRAIAEGPQHVTRHGRPAAVVVASDEWERQQVTGSKSKMSFAEFLLTAPQVPEGFEFELEPSNVQPRDVDFGTPEEAA